MEVIYQPVICKYCKEMSNREEDYIKDAAFTTMHKVNKHYLCDDCYQQEIQEQKKNYTKAEGE